MYPYNPYWNYYVGQALPAVPPQHVELTHRPEWPGARALVRSTIQSVVDNDAIFSQVFQQVVQHLTQRGMIDRRDVGRLMRPAFMARFRQWLRQAFLYADVDAIIDVATRQLIQYAQSHRASPFD